MTLSIKVKLKLAGGVIVQTLGLPTQVKPLSTMQVAEHPSPLLVFPSSHCSLELRAPSPQIFVGLHVRVIGLIVP